MSLQYNIYKGSSSRFGAVQFNLKLPVQNDKEEWQDGCVFLNITSATGPNVYDWSKKIVFALSVNDLAQLVFGMKTGNEVKLYHDPGAKSESAGAVKKSLWFTSPKGTLEGGMLTVSQQKGDEQLKHTVPLSGYELIALITLFETAISKCLGWS
jgi:hypothetical protein